MAVKGQFLPFTHDFFRQIIGMTKIPRLNLIFVKNIFKFIKIAINSRKVVCF